MLPMMSSHVLFEQMVALPGQQLAGEAFPRHETTESANKKDGMRTHLPCTKCNGVTAETVSATSTSPLKRRLENKFKFYGSLWSLCLTSSGIALERQVRLNHPSRGVAPRSLGLDDAMSLVSRTT